MDNQGLDIQPIGLGTSVPNPLKSGLDIQPITPGGSKLDIQSTTGLDIQPLSGGVSPTARDNSNDPWYKKAFDWTQTPLLDLHREGAGGLELGAEDIASSFTSPFQLALTLGTLGTSSVLEGLGVAAEELPTAVKGIRALIDAGFTIQQAHQVAEDSPRVLDALKDGDYETAKRLGVGVLAGSLFTALGSRHALHDAGEFAENVGWKVKPTEEVNKVRNEIGTLQSDYTQHGQLSKLQEEDLRKELGKTTPTRLGAIMRYIEAGGSKDVLQQRHDLLAEAADRIAISPLPKGPELPAGADKFSAKDLLPNQHTIEAYSDPKNPLSKEREDYRNHIVDSYLAGKTPVPETEQPTAVLTGGGTASGKTTLIREALKVHPDAVKNDPDEFNLLIPEYAELQKTDPLNASARVHEESSLMSHQLYDRAIQNRNNIIMDTTTSGEGGKANIQQAKAAGYRVELNFVDVPTDVAVERNNNRFLNSLDPINRGRYVPENVVRGIHERAAKTFFDIKDSADQVRLFDNSGTAPELIYERLDKNPEVVYNKDKYEAYQRKANGNEGNRSVQNVVQGKARMGAAPARTGVASGNGRNTPAGLSAERIAELTGLKKLKDNYTPKEIDTLLEKYAQARNLTPEELSVANKIRNSLADDFSQAHSKDLIKEAVANYQHHIWDLDKDPDNEAANNIKHEAKSGKFSTSASMARHRSFSSAFEGEMLGKHLKSDDPIALASYYANTIHRVISAREFLERIRDKGFRASDGRPMVAMAGTGHIMEGPNGENPAVLVNPNRIRSAKISTSMVKGLEQSGALDKYLAEDKIHILNPDEVKVGKKPIYGWKTDDFQNMDHPAFRDWNFAARANDGTKVLVNAELRAHPEMAEYMKRALGLDKSQLRESKLGGALLKGGARAKSILLSFSPFHLAQEGLRAIMTGINPIGIERWDLSKDPVLRNGVRAGLTLGRDYRNVQDFSEGVGGHDPLLSKIPYIGPMLDKFQSFLFDKYIPSLKARAYRSLVDRYSQLASSKGWSPTEVARQAASHTNEVFGGINYNQLGRSAASQDYFRLAALAPDWLESEVRAVARAFGKDGGIMRQDMVRMAGTLWLTSRVLNYLSTGEAHNEAPFGVVSKGKDGKEKVYSIRTLPTDMLHMASDPMGFVRGRFSPFVRAGEEVASGRDAKGHRLTPGQMAVDIVHNAAPIPFQAAMNNRTDMTTPDQLTKAAGGTVTNYRTEAEKLANQYAADKSSSGPVDSDQLGRHYMKVQFSDDIRSGKMGQKDIFDMVHTGQLGMKEGKDIIKEAEMTPLQGRFSRLSMKEALEVYKAATDREKAELSKELMKKRASYVKEAMKTMTPGQRAVDPTYRELRRIFPNLPPWGSGAASQ